MGIKILTIVGARPQFVKASVVSRVLKGREGVDEILVHTGQHYDASMSNVFFEQMGIPQPSQNLNIQSPLHGAMTARMLEQLEALMLERRPDKVMVYGDTNSTLAGALSASKLNIPVVHVEAGLRSFNMSMPEEVNRVLTDRVSQYLMCPTDTAVKNLEAEGYRAMPVVLEKTGDVMQDVARYYSKHAQIPSDLPEEVVGRSFVLTTVHRAENTDDIIRLKNVVAALNEIHGDVPVVFPVHPRTAKILRQENIVTDFHVIEPVGYLEMLWLLKNCQLVATDSGGLQKEAFFFAKPCITLRDETEWVELIDVGANMLAGADKSSILSAYSSMRSVRVTDMDDLYGGGCAAGRVVKAILC